MPSHSPFRTDRTRSPFNLDALERFQSRKTRAPFDVECASEPVPAFYTTPTVRLLETSLGLTAEQVERLFETKPVRRPVAKRSLVQQGLSAYRWFEFSGLTLALIAVGYATGAVMLG